MGAGGGRGGANLWGRNNPYLSYQHPTHSFRHPCCSQNLRLLGTMCFSQWLWFSNCRARCIGLISVKFLETLAYFRKSAPTPPHPQGGYQGPFIESPTKDFSPTCRPRTTLKPVFSSSWAKLALKNIKVDSSFHNIISSHPLLCTMSFTHQKSMEFHALYPPPPCWKPWISGGKSVTPPSQISDRVKQGGKSAWNSIDPSKLKKMVMQSIKQKLVGVSDFIVDSSLIIYTAPQLIIPKPLINWKL